MRLVIKEGRAKIGVVDHSAEIEKAQEAIDRAKGILTQQKGIKWAITSLPSGPKGRPSIIVKVGPKGIRWDSTWYGGSWTFVTSKDFSRGTDTFKLPPDVRSALFNLSAILPHVLKGTMIPLRFMVWDAKGNEEHLSVSMKRR